MSDPQDADLLAEQFEAHRTRLRAVAYRMLGSVHEADDAVQEAWLRLQGTEGIDNLAGWLTTVVSRICLDMLRARATRGTPVGELQEADALLVDVPPDPAQEAELADAVGSALVVVLQTLAPAERLAFVLHDLFAVSFDDIAAIIGRSPAASRQLASRGRRRVQRPDEPVGTGDRAVVEAFLAASRDGDFEGLLAVLDPSASVRIDAAAAAMGTQGGGTSGAPAVAEFFNGRARAVRRAVIDGVPGGAWVHQKETKVLFAFVVEEGLITEIELLADSLVITPSRVELVVPSRDGTA